MTTILHDGLREEIVHSGLVWFGVICSRVVLKLVIIQRGGCCDHETRKFAVNVLEAVI